MITILDSPVDSVGDRLMSFTQMLIMNHKETQKETHNTLEVLN